MADTTAFARLARDPDAPLDELALALAAAFRDVDGAAATQRLDDLGAELARRLADAAPAGELDEALAIADLLGRAHGFQGDRERYDDPANSMLDVVLERRRGLPILLSVVYVEVARRAGVPLLGVGLPGHFVAGHFGKSPPLLLDPFDGGTIVESDSAPSLLRPWTPHQIAMRMLNNLVGSFQRRGDLAAALRAAEMRTLLPADEATGDVVETELRQLRARLN